MNRFEKLLGKKRIAEIKYLDGEFQVMAQGDHVLCAVTGEPIALSDLKYWSVEAQEAYLNAEVAFRAHQARRS